MAGTEIWTIGHSTLPIDKFIDILNSFDIKLLADVRNYPGSRRYPHFNKETLEITLQEHNIKYIHMPVLGGRRRASKDSKHTEWKNPSFRGYADYMDTNQFADGIAELLRYSNRERTAIMCAEAYWRKCHRSMIADHLKQMGIEVCHITASGKCDQHTYSKPFAESNERFL